MLIGDRPSADLGEGVSSLKKTDVCQANLLGRSSEEPFQRLKLWHVAGFSLQSAELELQLGGNKQPLQRRQVVTHSYYIALIFSNSKRFICASRLNPPHKVVCSSRRGPILHMKFSFLITRSWRKVGI